MANSSIQGNNTVASLRRLTNQFDEVGSRMNDFKQRVANGEDPDPDEFMKLLEQRSHTQMAMQAQVNLHEKPLKTVLNETR